MRKQKVESGCGCGAKRVVVLYAALDRDTVPCARCGETVAVESVKLPPDLAQTLRRFVDQRFAIEALWFASAQYEDWAKGELDGPKSRINRLALELAQKMAAHVETYVLFKPHARAEQYIDPYLDPCPVCGGITEKTEFGDRFGRRCAACRVIGFGGEGE